MDAANMRRDFRRALPWCPDLIRRNGSTRVAALVRSWVLSDAGVPLEEIPRLVGHSGTTVTELVYRRQLKPVIQTGAR
jgi:hypothetical protein